MPKRNLKALISKIIMFYSVFFVVMKLIAVIFQDAWAIPNLLLAVPFLIFAVIGAKMMKQDKYSWIYVIAGVLVISIIRYYEMQWIVEMQQYFSS